MASQAFDLIVIGGGTAGLTAVAEALSLGVQRIAIVERQTVWGGECANYACVPTKTLVTAARIRQMMVNDAAAYGSPVQLPPLDLAALRRKQDVIIGDTGFPYADEPRVMPFSGDARFMDSHTLRVGDDELRGDHIIIATGVSPVVPDIPGLKDVGYWQYPEAARPERLPQSLIILGSGPVGCEFAHIYRWLGVQVTLVEKDNNLLKSEDPEIAEAGRKLLEKDGVRVLTACDITQVSRLDNGLKRITIESQTPIAPVEVEEILVAVGMAPRLESLDLPAAGVAFTDNGITASDTMATNQPHIWAVGDVVGPYRFTHVADRQAEVAVRNAFSGSVHKMDYKGLAWSVFTLPAIAHAGLTEPQAREACPEVDVVKTLTKKVSRYRIESQREGFIKLLIDRQQQVLLGGHLVADDADEIAQFLGVAIREALTVTQLLAPAYIYPSKLQLVQKALEQYVSERQ